MKVLKEFMNSLDFIRMKPDNSVIKGGIPEGGSARALVQPGRTIAVYLRCGKKGPGSAPLEIELPQGQWLAEWIDPVSGKISVSDEVEGGAVRGIRVPAYQDDAALRLTRRKQS